MTVHITTFGYLHAAPPDAHITLDLRCHYRDPHVRPELRYRTARDAAVRVAVMSTPGIVALVDAAATAVWLHQEIHTGPRRHRLRRARELEYWEMRREDLHQAAAATEDEGDQR